MHSMHHIPTVFFFNDTATTEIYTLSLHDALPIFTDAWQEILQRRAGNGETGAYPAAVRELLGEMAAAGVLMQSNIKRSEEHKSELQSRLHLVCRFLLEKKKDSAAEIARVLLCFYS